ncbi:hypothetical protein BESB_045500 [Besnoitia besnoiti]|uniref:Transmembrane protein n=1 Tax=Besnoitia besnoiti TaxID=94643 RepID=A0A2A9MCZ6_BESBE|nr:hypothetical protein BESB_045500 [Besnoitia besnoiti]PFH36358.1 hypothetical protein BESB_045500 [Besnoitia besnoiti]
MGGAPAGEPRAEEGTPALSTHGRASLFLKGLPQWRSLLQLPAFCCLPPCAVMSILIVLLLVVIALAVFVYYVNTKLAERDALKKKRPGKPRRKDREYWSLE